MTQTTTASLVSGLLLSVWTGCAGTGPRVRNLSSGPFAHRAKTEYRLSTGPSVADSEGVMRRVRPIHPRLDYQVRVAPSGASGESAEVVLSCRQDVGNRFRVYTYQYRLRPAPPRTLFAPNALGFPDGPRPFGRHTVAPGKQRLYVNVQISGSPALSRKWGRGVRLSIRSKLPFEAKAGQSIRIVVRLHAP